MRVLVIGSAEESGGGVATVLRTIRKMPVWETYSCRWLGTQIQRGYLWKLWYAFRAYCIALVIIWRYQIVHFHTVPDNICLAIQLPILLLAKLGRKKVIMHLHVGNQLEAHTQHGFFLWNLRRANAVVVLADKWKRLMHSEYQSIKAPVFVVPNACDAVEAIPYGDHDRTLLFAGALRPNKACHLILEAYANLREKYPDWRICMLGEGISHDALVAETHELGLEDYVTFTGQLSSADTKQFFQRAGIYCMCSFVEGFPMVVLESWRYGVPVVATPVGGLPDVSSEGNNLLMFDFGSVEQLTQALDRLMGDEQLREHMSEYSKRFVEEHFSLQHVDNILEQVYQSL